MAQIDIDKFVISLMRYFGNNKGIVTTLDRCLFSLGLKYVDTPTGGRLERVDQPTMLEKIMWGSGEQKPNKKYPKFKRGDILTDGKSIYKVLSWDYTEKNTAAYYMEGNGCKFSWGCEEADKKLKPVDLKTTELSEEDEKNLNEALSYIQDEALKDFIKDRMQPKQEWSEDDEERFQSCIKILQTSDGYDTINTKWLKSLKDRMQPRQEWSEEDEDNLTDIFVAIDNFHTTNHKKELITFLKSIKERVNWKPSKEQMVVLNDIIINGHLSNANERILKGLQEQLKKLREG